MKDYQQRVIEEKKQLDKKIEKLRTFLNTETFAELDLAERGRMHSQFNVMTNYSSILGERIDAFE